MSREYSYNRIITTIKNCICFFLICSMLFLSACSAGPALLSEEFQTEEYLSEYDMQVEYLASRGKLNKAGDVYYAMLGGWIFYYDEVSDTSGKLCAKAECGHEDNQCNAYISESAMGFRIYNEKIYWQVGGQLQCMDLQGNQRENVQNVGDMTGTNPYITLHRGFVYTTKVTERVEEGQAIQSFVVNQYVLGDAADEGKTVFSKECTGRMSYNYAIAGTKLYFFLEFTEKDAGNYQRELYVYDMNRDKTDLLWSGVGSEGFIAGMVLNEDGVSLLEFGMSSTMRVMRYDFGSKKMESGEAIPLAEGYGSIGIVDGYIMTLPLPMPQLESSPYRILDNEGNVVREGEVDGPMLSCYGRDETGILFQQMYPNGSEVVYRIIRISPDPEKEEEVLIEYIRGMLGGG